MKATDNLLAFQSCHSILTIKKGNESETRARPFQTMYIPPFPPWSSYHKGRPQTKAFHRDNLPLQGMERCINTYLPTHVHT